MEEGAQPEEAAQESDPLSEFAEALSKPVAEDDEEGQTRELSPEEGREAATHHGKASGNREPRIGFKFLQQRDHGVPVASNWGTYAALDCRVPRTQRRSCE